MAEAGDYHLLRSKRKAISALLPYAVRQERDSKPEVLGLFLCAARASKLKYFTWERTRRFAATQLSDASPWAVILVTPHILHVIGSRSLFQLWAAATSAVPHTEEVAQSVVDALLRFAFEDDLLLPITLDMWSWLKIQPSLPPVYQGGYYGTCPPVVKAVQGLEDIEILKSYLLIVWSEWGPLANVGFPKMCTSLHEDFGEIGMGHHRADLIQ